MRSDDAYDYAWANAERNPDGSRIEQSVIDLVKANVDFDADRAKEGLARRIVARRKRPGSTSPEGAVVFPGMEHYSYEPHRLLADDAGNVVENRNAPVKFKAAEANRAAADAEKAITRLTREQREANHFAVWAADQLANGRPPAEVTWDTCVHETGLWKDADVEDEESDEDGAE